MHPAHVSRAWFSSSPGPHSCVERLGLWVGKINGHSINQDGPEACRPFPLFDLMFRRSCVEFLTSDMALYLFHVYREVLGKVAENPGGAGTGGVR